MDRLAANRLILATLTNYVEAHPNIRFQQALTNLEVLRLDKESMEVLGRYSVLHSYNEESYDTYTRMVAAQAMMEEE